MFAHSYSMGWLCWLAFWRWLFDWSTSPETVKDWKLESCWDLESMVFDQIFLRWRCVLPDVPDRDISMLEPPLLISRWTSRYRGCLPCSPWPRTLPASLLLVKCLMLESTSLQRITKRWFLNLSFLFDSMELFFFFNHLGNLLTLLVEACFLSYVLPNHLLL